MDNKFRCSICNFDPAKEMGTTYRNGPVGIKDIEWRCAAHLDEKYKNKEIKRLCDIITSVGQDI